MNRHDRREFLRASFRGLGAFCMGASLTRCGDAETMMEGIQMPSIPQTSNIANLGPLLEPDALGLRLPAGFSAKIVARSSEPVPGTDYVWHVAPDGGAVFPADDGGYVYVSNSEALLDGGAGALRFDALGNLVDAYPILRDSTFNCAGGGTPWGTWLSCEERPDGRVFECDPFGKQAAIFRPALGIFKHEAAAVDPVNNHLYLTEDQEDGRFYRYTPDALVDGRPDLSKGTLHVLRVLEGEEGAVEWLEVPDASGSDLATKDQVPQSTAFTGGEGLAWHKGIVYFTTKGDNRVWAYDTNAQDLVILYDDDTSPNPILTGVDNVMVTPAGDVLVAEDGGDMQLIALHGDSLIPIVQVTGQDRSEITGPALCPYRKRLYFSSQRGEGGLIGEAGLTYEISGPFFID